MMPRMMRRILAVVAKIVNDKIVSIEQRPPEWKIAVDCEPIAMAQHQTRALRSAVPAQTDDGPVIHDGVENIMWRVDSHWV
jgi:hypothetical protein